MFQSVMLVKRSAQVLFTLCAAFGCQRMPQRKPRLTRLLTHRYLVDRVELRMELSPTHGRATGFCHR